MNTIKLWITRYFLRSFSEFAYATNDHNLADNVIVALDAVDEIERRLKK